MFDLDYDYTTIEFEDESFNHYLHHFDECLDGMIHFNEELDCIEPMSGCYEEYEWK